MPIIDDNSYKNSSETNLEVSVITPQLMGINRILERDFTSLIIQLIRAAFERDFDVVEEVLAIHHFSRTDGFFSGNKSLEIVQLLCGQCFGDCYKQQTYVTRYFLRLP